MPITIAIMNFKGGVGKTTLTANLAANFASWGNKVLMIDASSQASLTYFFQQKFYKAQDTILRKFQLDNTETLVDDLIIYPDRVNEIVQRICSSFYSSSGARLALLPAFFGEWPTDDLDRQNIDSYSILSRAIAKMDTMFDLIFIDCQSDFGIITKNSLLAANYVLIPVKLDEISMISVKYSVGCIASFVSEYSQMTNTKVTPKEIGLVAMMVQKRKEKLISVQEQYQEKIRGEFLYVPDLCALVNPNQTPFYTLYYFSKTCRLNNSVFANWYNAPAVCFGTNNKSEAAALNDLEEIACEVAGWLRGNPFHLNRPCRFSSE